MNVATAIAPLGQPGHATLATHEADSNSLSVADSPRRNHTFLNCFGWIHFGKQCVIAIE